jgi:hypothetical protein
MFLSFPEGHSEEAASDIQVSHEHRYRIPGEDIALPACLPLQECQRREEFLSDLQY